MRYEQEGWRISAKRGIDVAVASIGLLALAPLLVIAIVAILALMGRPAFFIQARPGRGARPFPLVKLRTMTVAPESEQTVGTDGMRLTRLGRLLRATSLDELPQLWNVLLGDMSLVGPRPLLMKYLPRYSPQQSRRHNVLPGITGWAQVNGRNAISWEEKFGLDVWYVDHWSVALDLRILVLTALRVATRSGISKKGHATMPEFMGTEAAPLEEEE